MTKIFLGLCLTLPAISYILYYYVLDRSAVSAFHYGLSKFILFVLPFAYVYYYKRQKLKFFTCKKEEILWGMSSGVIAAVVILLFYMLFIKGSAFLQGSADNIKGVMGNFGVNSLGTYVVLGLFISLGNSLVEEYYWRWFLFGQLKQEVSVYTAAILSSLGFAAHHFIFLINNLAFAPMAFILFLAGSIVIGALFWCYLYNRFQSLTAPFLCHMIIDIGLIILGYDLIFLQ